MRQAGFVLVGGRSSRMSRDKALLDYGGKTLAQHVAGEVLAAAGSVTLVGSPERYSHLGFPVIADEFPETGPLGGIVTALGSSTAEWNLVLACDMPGVRAELLSRLLDHASSSGADCVVPLSPSGKPEPLCAVYRRTCNAPFRTALASGVRRISSALENVRPEHIGFEAGGWFENVNTPADWHAHLTHCTGHTDG